MRHAQQSALAAPAPSACCARGQVLTIAALALKAQPDTDRVSRFGALITALFQLHQARALLCEARGCVGDM